MRIYLLPSHDILYLLQEIKDTLEPSTRSHAIPGLSRLLANLNFWPPILFNVLLLLYFFIPLFATTLICPALGMLHWSICK